MAEVQWIRLIVGMFDGNSFKKIKRAKIGGVPFRDKLTAVWFELLDLAGKSNSNGCLIDNNEIPYRSFEDIATMLDRDEKEIELCVQYFISERMIEIIDDVYCLTNFMRYQNQDGLEKIREQTRKRVAEYRERKRLAQGNAECNVTVTLRNAIEEEKEKDKEKDKYNKENIQKKVRKQVAFVPPTYEEVLVYAREKKREDIAKEFYDYFNVGDWVDSEGKKVQNWKQKFLTWCSRNKKKDEPKPKERYGDFDVDEAYRKALNRSYGTEEKGE